MVLDENRYNIHDNHKIDSDNHVKRNTFMYQ
jgi:hypothetical protein